MDILPNKTTNINILEKTGPPKQEGEGGLKLSGIPSLPKMGNYVADSKWLLVSSLFILIVVVVIWAGLFFYDKSLSREKDALDQKMAELKKTENKEIIVKITSLENSLSLVKNLLAAHAYTSKIFSFLEEMTLSNVVWENFSFNAAGTEILLDGRAQTLSVAAKQILVFEGDKRVANASVSGAQLDRDGGVGFSIKINLDPKILNARQ